MPRTSAPALALVRLLMFALPLAAIINGVPDLEDHCDKSHCIFDLEAGIAEGSIETAHVGLERAPGIRPARLPCAGLLDEMVALDTEAARAFLREYITLPS